MQVDLWRADVRQLEAFFLSNSDNLALLSELNELLKRRNDDDSNMLHVKVAHRLKQLKSNTNQQPVATATASNWISRMLEARNLREPDGRPIFGYRLNSEEYDRGLEILTDVCKRLSSGAYCNRHEGALAFAMSAEWFRRQSETAFPVWNEVANGVLSTLAYKTKVELTETGRKFWSRPLIRNSEAQSNEYLLSVAFDGGFPVKVLEKEHSRLTRFLRSIMARADHTSLNARQLLRISTEESELLPKTYRHRSFIVVAAMISGMLLMLRRWAQRQATTLRLPESQCVALLDLKFPAWRNKLPLYIPPQGTGLARRILDDLVSMPFSAVRGEVRAQRLLVAKDGIWRPGIRISLDGEVDLPKTTFLRERIIVEPAGALAKVLPARMAVIDPPSLDNSRWRLRPIIPLEKAYLVGFGEQAEMLLRQGRAYQSRLLEAGEALKGDIIVFKETESQEHLEFIGKGSVRSRADFLYVLSTNFLPAGPEAAKPLPFEGEGRLFRISTGTLFTNPLEDGFVYWIEPKSSAVTRNMEFHPNWPTKVRSSDPDMLLHKGPISRPELMENGERLAARHGEVLWKVVAANSRTGKDWPANPLGRIDIRWQEVLPDGKPRMIDRIRVGVLPAGFGVSTSNNGLNSVNVQFSGLEGWTVSARSGGDRSVDQDGHVFRIRFPGRLSTRQEFELTSPGGSGFSISIDLPLYRAAVVCEDGSVLSNKAVSIEELRSLVAYSPRGGDRLIAGLSPPSETKVDKVDFEVPGERSLGPLRRHVAALRASQPSLDSKVTLTFAGEGIPSLVVGYPAPLSQSKVDPGLLYLDGGRKADAGFVRAVFAPWEEVKLDVAREGFWRLPQKPGPFIAYTRTGGTISSRPALIPTPAESVLGLTGIGAATLIAEEEARKTAIRNRLARIAEWDPRAANDLDWLKQTTLSLNGLPAASVDALRILPEFPRVLARLLTVAKDANERRAIIALEEELPFLWLALPATAWDAVGAGFRRENMEVLRPLFGEQRAAAMAEDGLSQVAREVALHATGLDGVFHATGWLKAKPEGDLPLRELIQMHLKKLASMDHNDRRPEVEEPLAISYIQYVIRNKLLLPQFISNYSLHYQPHLLAPFILAAIVRGKIALNSQLIWLLHQSLIFDPEYVGRALSTMILSDRTAR